MNLIKFTFLVPQFPFLIYIWRITSTVLGWLNVLYRTEYIALFIVWFLAHNMCLINISWISCQLHFSYKSYAPIIQDCSEFLKEAMPFYVTKALFTLQKSCFTYNKHCKVSVMGLHFSQLLTLKKALSSFQRQIKTNLCDVLPDTPTACSWTLTFLCISTTLGSRLQGSTWDVLHVIIYYCS